MNERLGVGSLHQTEIIQQHLRILGNNHPHAQRGRSCRFGGRYAQRLPHVVGRLSQSLLQHIGVMLFHRLGIAAAHRYPVAIQRQACILGQTDRLIVDRQFEQCSGCIILIGKRHALIKVSSAGYGVKQHSGFALYFVGRLRRGTAQRQTPHIERAPEHRVARIVLKARIIQQLCACRRHGHRGCPVHNYHLVACSGGRQCQIRLACALLGGCQFQRQCISALLLCLRLRYNLYAGHQRRVIRTHANAAL